MGQLVTARKRETIFFCESHGPARRRTLLAMNRPRLSHSPKAPIARVMNPAQKRDAAQDRRPDIFHARYLLTASIRSAPRKRQIEGRVLTSIDRRARILRLQRELRRRSVRLCWARSTSSFLVLWGVSDWFCEV